MYRLLLQSLRRTTLLIVGVLISGCSCCFATNIVTYHLLERSASLRDTLALSFRNISNADGRVRVAFDIRNAGVPFTIYKAAWANCDTIYSPLEPFSLIAAADEVDGKDVEWHISVDFPFSQIFDDTDALILHTDRGMLRCPTSRSGGLLESIDMLRADYEGRLDRADRSSRRAWWLLSAVICAVALGGGAACVLVRRKLTLRRRQVEEQALMIAERTRSNDELHAKVDALYGSRLDTLNMLCNEYFDKNGSDRMRALLYKDVEKHILALRDADSVAELEKVVNTYRDGILTRIREEMPGLSRSDLRFLTYLYAGFSPRAVCIFTDIKIKNFYNRRSRLKERIMASGAPHSELFVSMM